LVFQWRKNGALVAGANSATLTFDSASGSDAGVYTVDIGNDGGRITSASATLTVANEPPITGPNTLTTASGAPVSVPASELIANDVDPEGADLVLIAVSGISPVTFTADFNAGLPSGATAHRGGDAGGGGYWAATGGVDNSGKLVLTDNVNNQQGALVIDELTPGRSVSAFNASFQIRIGDGSQEPADGFSFNFADNLPNGISTGAENGVGNGFSFCIRNYRFSPWPGGGTANTTGVKIRYRGQDIVGQATAWPWNSSRYVPIDISVTAEGILNVLIDGTNVFSNVQLPSYTPARGRFGLYARTGGQNVTHWVDDLSITAHTLETSANPDFLLFGNAYIASGALRLTDAVNSQAGSFIINDLAPGEPVLSFVADFKVQIGSGSADGADGMSFNFADDLPNAAVGATPSEDGVGNGLSICIDNYSGGVQPPGPAIRVKYAGVFIESVLIPKWNSPDFIPVSVVLAPNGEVTVSVNGTNVIENLATPYQATTGRFGLYARTGGLNQRHWVDDLNITAEILGDSVSYAQNFNAGAYGTVVLSEGVVTYTPPSGFSGVDTFYYIVSDGQGGSSAGLVTVTVEAAVGEPPVISECAEDQTIVAENGTVEMPDLRAGVQVTPGSGEVTIVQSPAPGATVGGGVTVVTFTVTNADGQDTCTANVRVLVPVAFTNVTIVDGQITAQIQTIAGLTYRVQVATELNPNGETEWMTIPNSEFEGTGGVVPLAAPIAAEGNAFFRIVVE
jgi:hypothetical protein